MCEKLNELNKLYIIGDYERTSFNLLSKVKWNKIPIDMKEVLRRLDILSSENNFEDSVKILRENNIHKSIQGMVFIDGSDIKIYYNPRYNEKDLTENKINFILAHEFAHSILHNNEIINMQGFIDFYELDNNQNDKKEIESNILAGEILMPRKVFITLFETARETKSIRQTKEALSEIFNVPVNLVDERIKYLNLINENYRQTN